MAPTKARPARRLSPEARRDQLIGAAAAVIAEAGYTDFSLDAVAERADVTRNLLYHYFPRGRLDLFLAALARAGAELTEGWDLAPDVPAAERTARNLGRAADHVLANSEAWRLYRQARGVSDPEVQAAIRGFGDALAANVAANQYGEGEPPPLVAAAVRGAIAYTEEVLDEARERGVDREEIEPLILRTFDFALRDAIKSAGG